MDSFKSDLHVVIQSGNGSAIWVPPASVGAGCVMDMTFWPYDVHNCTATFGSWVHSSKKVDLIVVDEGVEVRFQVKPPDFFNSSSSVRLEDSTNILLNTSYRYR